MQVIGLCRFSYPAIGGFQVEHNSLEERMTFLYDRTRMEERFSLLETVTLPALKAQTDPEFNFVILIGDSLPTTYEARLRVLCADIPQITIRVEAPAQHRPLVRRVFNEARHDMSAPCLQFRLDDDDAVALDFVENLRKTARTSAALLAQHPYFAFDFNNGFLLRMDPDGLKAAEVIRPYFTAGLAVHVAGGKSKSVMNFSHHRIYERIPTLTLNTRAMFVRTHNLFNDSRQGRVKPERLEPITAAQERMLKRCFAIDTDQLRARLPST